MSYNIEKGFLSKLLETKDIKTIKDKHITAEFLTGEHKNVFLYIQECLLKTGEVPTPRAVMQKYPRYKIEEYTVEGEVKFGTEENLLYWCTEVRNKAKHNKIADAIEGAAKNIESLNTEEAYSFLKSSIAYIENEIVESDTVDITKDTEDRVTAYKKRQINQGVTGISTGIKSLDAVTGGLMNETSTVIIAKTGVGKTFFEVLLAAYCQLNGYRVLNFVTEMSTAIMRDRYEAILFSMMYGSFNYKHFKKGTLDKKTEDNYFKFLREDLPQLDPLLLKTATGVMGIAAEIDIVKPDIVFIDGLYLMQDDQGAKEDWARLTHISRDIKVLAKTKKIPIVSNTQIDIKSKGGLSGIKYAQAIAQDADCVIELERDEVMINDSELEISVPKNREGIPAKIRMNWDFSTMDFSDIYSEQFNKEPDEPASGVIGLGGE